MKCDAVAIRRGELFHRGKPLTKLTLKVEDVIPFAVNVDSHLNPNTSTSFYLLLQYVLRVILSAAKDLFISYKILHFVQNDNLIAVISLKEK